MKHRIIIAMLMSVAIAAGCSKSDTPNIPDPSTPDSYEPSTTPIAFQTEYNWGDEEATTKGDLVEQFSKGDTFSVLGYYLNGGVWNDTSATPNFMYNQEVVYDGKDWSYSPLKYWSNNTTDRFRFYAFAPHSATIEPSPNTHAGYPYLTYTPSVNAPEMIDFMVAAPVEASKDAPSIVFEFKHQLAQLAFSTKHLGNGSTADGTTADKVKITGITIDGIYPHTGDFIGDGSFVWRSSANASEEKVECVTDITNGGLINSYIVNGETNDDLEQDKDGFYRLTNTEGQIMMSPQTFSNATDDDGKEIFEVGVEFDLIKSHGPLQTDVVMSAATTMTFEPLKIEQGYTYNLRFELSIKGYNYVILGSDIIREEWKVGEEHDFGTVE